VRERRHRSRTHCLSSENFNLFSVLNQKVRCIKFSLCISASVKPSLTHTELKNIFSRGHSHIFLLSNQLEDLHQNPSMFEREACFYIRVQHIFNVISYRHWNNFLNVNEHIMSNSTCILIFLLF